VNHQWTTLEANSSLCTPDAPKHLACFNSQKDIITCLQIPGAGNDECYALGYSGGCPCNISVGTCDTASWCNPADNECVPKAYNEFISGSKTTNEKDLIITLDKTIAVNRLSYCRINYQNGGYAGSIGWTLWGSYKGVETKICDGVYVYSLFNGYFWIPANVSHSDPWGFPVQAIDSLRINFSSTGYPDPSAFQGTFSFG
jgi:hypothetical protein